MMLSCEFEGEVARSNHIVELVDIQGGIVELGGEGIVERAAYKFGKFFRVEGEIEAGAVGSAGHLELHVQANQVFTLHVV